MEKIYIDAGHGGTDGGAAANGIKEKDITLKLALKTRDYLLRTYEGLEVKLSRTDDRTLTLSERTQDANSWGADLLVSIHINAATATSAHGFETFRYITVSEKTKTLQNLLHRSIMKYIDIEDRAQKAANFHMLRESRMPAVLTENGFISNASEAKLMKDESWLDKVAQGHAEGIAEFLGLKKKAVQPTAPTMPDAQPERQKLYKVQVGAFLEKENAEAMQRDLQKLGYRPFIRYE